MQDTNPFNNIQIPNTDGSHINEPHGMPAPLEQSSVEDPLTVSVDVDDRYTASRGEIGVDSYKESVSVLAEQLESVSMDGTAIIPTLAWYDWSRGARMGAEPEHNRTVSYDEIAEMGKGWKLHLNFDAKNSGTVSNIRLFLETLKEYSAISFYKIGQGGGKDFDAPGKEATVYVGHRDKAKLVAQAIDEALASQLIEPEGDAINDDIEFAPHVMGRFEISGFDAEFHQYGAKGYPLQNEVIGQMIVPPLLGAAPEFRREFLQEHSAGAEAILRDRYGVFFTGS